MIPLGSAAWHLGLSQDIRSALATQLLCPLAPKSLEQGVLASPHPLHGTGRSNLSSAGSGPKSFVQSQGLIGFVVRKLRRHCYLPDCRQTLRACPKLDRNCDHRTQYHHRKRVRCRYYQHNHSCYLNAAAAGLFQGNPYASFAGHQLCVREAFCVRLVIAFLVSIALATNPRIF